MDESVIALGRRAVACPAWRWMEGMKPATAGDDHYARTRRCGWTWNDYREEWSKFMGLDFASGAPAWGWPSPTSGWVPDLDDPATLGCLLALVRDAYGRPDLTTRANRACTEWVIDVVGTPDTLLAIVERTEAEALVAALGAYVWRRA